MLRNTRRLSIALLTLVALSGTMLAAQETTPPPEAPPSPPPLVDINSAALAEIGQIVGSEELAVRIIEGRPYANKRQILSRELVTAEHYEQIRERIIARRVETQQSTPEPQEAPAPAESQ